MKNLFIFICLFCLNVAARSQQILIVDTVFHFGVDSLKCKFSIPSDSTKIFEKSETSAHFPGSQKEWNSYLKNNLRKKDVLERDNNTVVVQFIVKKDGSLTKYKVLQFSSTEQGDEALRLIKESGQWIPATQNGYCVNAYVKVAISFKK